METEAKLKMRTVIEVTGTLEELLKKATPGAEIELESGIKSFQDCLSWKGPVQNCMQDANGYFTHFRQSGEWSCPVPLGQHLSDRWVRSSLGPVIRRGDRFFLVVVKPEEKETATTVTGTIDGEDAVRHLADSGHHTKIEGLVPLGTVS